MIRQPQVIFFFYNSKVFILKFIEVSVPSTSEVDLVSLSSTLASSQCPLGNKKAKKHAHLADVETAKSESLRQIADAAVQKNVLFAEHTTALKEATQLKLISMSSSELDLISKQLLALKKRKLLVLLEKEEGIEPDMEVEE